MVVKVIIKRKIPEDRKAEVLPLIIQMRALATSQPGYICGETLVNSDDLEEFIVISSWNDLDSWSAWRLSKQRAEIDNKLEALLEEKTEYKSYFSGDVYLYQKL